MADPFVAEIRIFPFNFAPRGWAWCNGQVMPISQNTALFSLLGTTYGGNGQTTFALPDLQGSAPMHPGQGPGLSNYLLGESGGSDTVTLLQSEIPAHAHNANVTTEDGDRNDPTLRYAGRGTALYAPMPQPLTAMSPEAIAPSGGDQPHNNMQPYLTLFFAIALQGIFPPRG
jgi:microcystin-dependent protein